MISLVRALLCVTTMSALTAVAGVSALSLSYVREKAAELPDHGVIAEWRPEEGTTILAADGSVLGTHSRQRRTFVPLAAIPSIVVDAFVAAEDGAYWHHSGVDPAAMARALIANLKGLGRDRVEGGSTITQQVVKNLMLGPERTIERKVREALLAMRADRDLGKRRVLEIYLNEIYLGAGAYGIAEAARTYFDKALTELSLGEAATLAGLPKAPSASNPVNSPAEAARRRNYVLDRMLEEGMISATEAAETAARPLRTAMQGMETSPGRPAMWYPEEEARRRALSRVGPDAFYGDGGIVTTTIDPALQETVHAALRRGLVRWDRRGGWREPLAVGVPMPVDWTSSFAQAPPGAEDWTVGIVTKVGRDALLETVNGPVTLPGASLRWAAASGRADAFLDVGHAVLLGDLGSGPELVQLPQVQGAAVLLEPGDGSVRAMDGGFSGAVSEFNRATQARRQTGSVFKTFVYLAALEMGYDGASPVLDSPIAIAQGSGRRDWTPGDADGHGLGLITLRRSLEQSRNMSTVRLLYDVGPEAVGLIAGRVGFNLPKSIPYAMALGALEATPMEVAAAYAAIANGGRGVVPRLIATDPPSYRPETIDPAASAQVTSILRGVISEGTARSAFAGFEHPVAGKTGTTNAARDAWFVAYGPAFVLAVWVGNDDFTPLGSGATGGSVAAPIARDILDHAIGIEWKDFLLPDGVEEVLVDRETGARSETGDLIELVRPD